MVTFAQGGDVDITTSFDTAKQGYAVTINSSTFDAAGDTDFLNTGTVILGNDASDVLTFAGGLATTGNDRPRHCQRCRHDDHQHPHGHRCGDIDESHDI